MDDQDYNKPEISEQASDHAESRMDDSFQAGKLMTERESLSSKESNAAKTDSLVKDGVLPSLDLGDMGKHASSSGNEESVKRDGGHGNSKADSKNENQLFRTGLAEDSQPVDNREHVPQGKNGKNETAEDSFFNNDPQDKKPENEQNENDSSSPKFGKDSTTIVEFGNQNTQTNILQGISDRIANNVNSSNQPSSYLPAVGALLGTAATLGTARLGEVEHAGFQLPFDGPKVTRGWQDLPERNAVINPQVDPNTKNMAVSPEDWKKCANDVNTRTDDLGRRWGNCAEKAATACNDILEQIRNNPEMAGCSVRQCWSPVGHSWAEVKMPNGEIRVVDPWRGQSGNRDELSKAYPAYSAKDVISTGWHNAENSPASAARAPKPAAPANDDRFWERNRRQSLGGR